MVSLQSREKRNVSRYDTDGLCFSLLTLRGIPLYEGFFRFDSNLPLYAYSDSSMKTASGSGLYR